MWLQHQGELRVRHLLSAVQVYVLLGAHVCLFSPAVPTFPEEGCQQASDHAAEAEAIQESDHPRLQDTGPGTHQHGRGITTLFHNVTLISGLGV